MNVNRRSWDHRKRILFSPSYTLSVNLMGYWKLDETSGSLLDSVGSSNLTNNGVATSVSGKINNASNFVRTSSQYLSVSDNSALSANSLASVTLSCWVRMTTVPALNMFIAGKATGSNATTEYILFYTSAVNFRFGGSNGVTSGGALTPNSSVSAGIWYNVIGWYDAVGDVFGIQVNNGTVYTSSYSAGLQDTAQPFTIGGNPSAATLYLNGDVDEVGFWKRVLSPEERQFLYNNGNGVSFPFM